MEKVTQYFENVRNSSIYTSIWQYMLFSHVLFHGTFHLSLLSCICDKSEVKTNCLMWKRPEHNHLMLHDATKIMGILFIKGAAVPCCFMQNCFLIIQTKLAKG